MNRSAVSLSLLLWLGASYSGAQNLTFVVMGDDRSEAAMTDASSIGINRPELTKMAKAVAKEKPAFVLFNGDLAYGYNDDHTLYRLGLDQWYDAMASVFRAGIAVYPVRGNHDAAGAGGGPLWLKFLKDHHISIPNNGPANEKGFTYYIDRGNVRVVALDDYAGKSYTRDEARGQVKGNPFPHTTATDWVAKLPKPKKGTHVFGFSHEMPFHVGSHPDSLNSVPDSRDRLLDSLYAMGGRVFFAGHDHDYDVVLGTSPKNPKVRMLQSVVGTAGAPFYNVLDTTGNTWSLEPHAHLTYTYGYVVVHVQGPKVTMIFKGRDIKAMPEETSYTVKQTITYTKSSSGTVWKFNPENVVSPNRS